MNNLSPRGLGPQYRSAKHSGPAAMGRNATSETAAALKAWAKRHPNPVMFNLGQSKSKTPSAK